MRSTVTILVCMSLAVIGIPVSGNADEPDIGTHSQSGVEPAGHGRNRTLQELGTGIQPLNLHTPLQGPGTANGKTGIQNSYGRENSGPVLPGPAAPVPPLVPLGSHTTVAPQSIPPPAFGPSGRR